MSRSHIILLVAALGMIAIGCTSSSQEVEDDRPEEVTIDQTPLVDDPPEDPAAPVSGEGGTLPPLEWPGMVVEADWLMEMHSHEDLLVIHVAEDGEFWSHGAIPGQVYLPFEVINEPGGEHEPIRFPAMNALADALAEAGIDDERYVVITGDREGLMAARLWTALDLLGHGERAALLQGGLAAWREADLPTAAQPAEPSPIRRGELTVRDGHDRRVDTEFVHEHLESEGMTLVDARPAEEYRGDEPGDDIRRAGHIPGASNYFWKDALDAEDRPHLLRTTQIAAGYDERDIPANDTLITYCRTGLQASFGYFLARLSGREARLYDPSYLYWQSDEERPFVRMVF